MHHKFKGCPQMSDAEYVERWKARCVMTERGCWEWQGFCQEFRNIKPGQRGYPVAGYRGKQVRIHRKMVEIHLRPFADGEICMHTCDNPPCINPDHLKIGTYTENMRDCSAKGRADEQWKTHCLRGHPLSGDNLEWKRRKGTDLKLRCCKTCSRIRWRIRAGWSPEEAETPVAASASERGKRGWAKRRAKAA